MRPILVLGASGMLGQGVLAALQGYPGDVQATIREGKQLLDFPDVSVLEFDAGRQNIDELSSSIREGSLIVNCIGIIKPYIRDDNQAERDVAMRINGLFPTQLAQFAEAKGHEVIQIATDCVYSGAQGMYSENDVLDALDVYGKTKALGEAPSQNMMHIRVSIIGPEKGRSTSLFEWVRNQPRNAVIGGFTDHLWNGVTTYHFGKVVRGIAEFGGFRPGVFHLVPADIVTKERLVRLIASSCNRGDLSIEPRESGKPINRTLQTQFHEMNLSLWRGAGYSQPPTIEEMIAELG